MTILHCVASSLCVESTCNYKLDTDRCIFCDFNRIGSVFLLSSKMLRFVKVWAATPAYLSFTLVNLSRIH